MEEEEEREQIERQRGLLEEYKRAQMEREAREKRTGSGDGAGSSTSTATDREGVDLDRREDVNPKDNPSTSSGDSSSAKLREHSGLCVICQDHEANIAIVDCGHLAMCMGCSELVMTSSRECPLCRTRIVTEQRLLRIFKT